jgi:hypothetical protein
MVLDSFFTIRTALSSSGNSDMVSIYYIDPKCEI